MFIRFLFLVVVEIRDPGRKKFGSRIRNTGLNYAVFSSGPAPFCHIRSRINSFESMTNPLDLGTVCARSLRVDIGTLSLIVREP
jgi:hypothetical protein